MINILKTIVHNYCTSENNKIKFYFREEESLENYVTTKGELKKKITR